VVPDEPNLCNHVTDGEDGVVVESSEAGVRRVLGATWDSDRIRETALPWSREAFRDRARELIEDALAENER
jgi:hypothetical protein